MINRRTFTQMATATLTVATLGLVAPAAAQGKGELVYMTRHRLGRVRFGHRVKQLRRRERRRRSIGRSDAGGGQG